MSKGSAIVSILIAFVGGLLVGTLFNGDFEAGSILADSGPLGAAPDDNRERFQAPVTDAQPWKGTEDALVTIVEISDFECPFCSRVNPTISQIMNEYQGKVRLVWRNNPLPFHQRAPLAHQAAMEAFDQGGNEKFWAMHDLLFENRENLERADLERYAQQVGLNMTEFRAALDNNEHEALVQADQALAQRIAANGTPHFVINGRKIAGAQPFERFKTIIDEELATAEAIVAAGTPAARVYATVMQAAQAEAGAPAGRGAAQKQAARPQPDPDAVYRIEVGSEPSKGPRDALVTIVQVSDFQCPFCSRVEPTINQVVEQYGRDVRVVWFNNPLPFHDNAGPAAQAALEAYDQGGNAKFWRMHELLFSNQQALGRDNLEGYARQIGLNMGQFRAALDNNEHQEAITAQQQAAARLGARGTPAFFINGRNISGAQPLAAFTRVIDQELEKARAKVRSGTPRARIYAETIRNGATSPQVIQPAGGGQPAAARPAAPPPDQVYELTVPRDAPRRGPRNARVVIQQFSDFQCPFCSRVNPTLDQVREEYGNRIQIVWRHFPLPMHANAPVAHQASIEVYRQGGDAKFWAYHDVLFQNQQALSRPDLERYAQQVGGINMAQFRQALDSNRHQARMQADVTAITEAGARIGTPSFFINGRLLQGAQPFAQFKVAIDAALAAR